MPYTKYIGLGGPSGPFEDWRELERSRADLVTMDHGVEKIEEFIFLNSLQFPLSVIPLSPNQPSRCLESFGEPFGTFEIIKSSGAVVKYLNIVRARDV